MLLVQSAAIDRVVTVYTVTTSYPVDMEGVNRMGIRQFRAGLGQAVDDAHFREKPTVVEHNGRPRAVLISHARYLRMLELETAAGVDEPTPRAFED
jgi:PHD/YefM family antitoxin component YafN of YafNO toxin-antitoxin module